MHRGYTAERYLERLAEARRIVPDLAVSTDIIVGFPGETDDDFERTLEVAAAARFDDAFTFIFSPRPGTEAAAMTDRFVDPAVAGERFDRLRVVIERSALAAQRGAGRADRGGARRGAEQEGPGRDRGPHRQHRLVHFTPPRPLRAGTYATVEVTGRRAAPPHGALRRAARRAGAQAAASPSPPCERAARPSSCSGRRRRASRTSRWPPPAAVAGTEIVAVDAMQVYRGMDIGTAKPTAADRAAVVHHCSTSSSRRSTFTVADFRAAYDARRRRRSPGRPLAGGRHRAVPEHASSTASRSPASTRRSGPSWRPEPDADGAAPPARRARSGGGRAHRAGQPAAHRAGARGRARQRPAVQLVRAGARRPTRRPTS